MEYQTLYRRWRPHGFFDFVGQSHVVTTLSNAILTQRIAHAYLFTGPRGTGKTSTAKIFAKALNCENRKNADPCDQCSSCTRINEGIFMDVLEIDAASNRGIDEIRDLREKVKYAPAEGKYKIYIIDEVHMLTAEAFNALLKTLEEPPPMVVFILATTEVHKIPLTILSRCQRFDFKRFTINEIKGRLVQILKTEEIGFSEQALELIAEHSEGGMRDAVSLLEQVLAHSQEQIKEENVRAILGLIAEEEILRIVQAIKEHNTQQALTLLNNIILDGKDLFQFGRNLVQHFRALLIKSLTGVDQSIPFNTGELVHIIETLADANNETKKNLQSSLPLELALIKLTVMQAFQSDLEARVYRLEQLIKQTSVPGSSIQHGDHSVSLKPVQPQVGTVEKKPVGTLSNQPKQIESGPQYDWSAFLEAVKKKKRTLAALIQEGKPLSFNSQELIVGMPAHLKFHLENLLLPQNQEILENILHGMAGSTVKLSCIPVTDNPANLSPKTAANDEPEVLTKAVQLFGGEVRPVTKEEK